MNSFAIPGDLKKMMVANFLFGRILNPPVENKALPQPTRCVDPGAQGRMLKRFRFLHLGPQSARCVLSFFIRRLKPAATWISSLRDLKKMIAIFCPKRTSSEVRYFPDTMLPDFLTSTYI
jgi:hypothetical protein